MKRWIYIFIVLLPLACKKEAPDTYLTPEKSLWYFKEIKAICDRDNANLWGKNLYGPVMFVDRASRKIIANIQDNNGLLKVKDGIYTGIYPRELIIDNTTTDFGGTTFALVPLPPQEDTVRIINRSVNALFHSFQKEVGINSIRFNIRLMDGKSQRLLLKLEWRALRKAMNSDGDNRNQALRDALIFREARREQFPQEINDENNFESYQGLGTFTTAILCSNSDSETKKYLNDMLDRFYGFQSFTRSYGYIHGALYAYLAHENGVRFDIAMTDSLDLAKIARDSYRIELPEICRDVAGSLAVSYELESIYREEEERITQNKERMHRQIEVFTEKPVVFLDLESPYFDFEPENIRTIDTLGTIYTSIRISDNWGKLSVEKGGCLISYNLKTLRVTAKNLKESKNHYYGDGWQLILNNDWEIAKDGENYIVRKTIPND
jgi:hypothetical protein